VYFLYSPRPSGTRPTLILPSPHPLRPFSVLRPGVATAIALILSGAPDAAEAQETCPDGVISDIVIINHSVFPPEELPDDGRLRWAYRLSNSARFRTREEVIRSKLLFEEGDCFEERLAEESGRILREFRFLGRAELSRSTRPDGSVVVHVETRDEWSTKLSLSLRFEDGIQFEGASLAEENLLGRGATLEFYRVTREAEHSTGALTEMPDVAGSGWDVVVGGHRGRIGSGAHQMLIHPFEGEIGRHAVRQSASRTRTLFPFVLPSSLQQEPESFTHLVIPLVTERADISAARRWGEPGDLRLLGAGVSYERVGPGAVESAEGVFGGRFGDRTPVSADQAAPLASQLVPRQAVRLNLIAGLRRVAFQYRFGLDALTGVQDFPVGREVLFTAGRSLGSTGPGRPTDVFAGLAVRLGWGGESTAAYLSGTLEGRRQDLRGAVAGRWGDVLTETHAFFYWQPFTNFSRTVVLRATAQGGWETSSPFQLTLGGADGVRGYRELDLPVGRMVVVTAENRGRFPWPFPGLVDLGFTLFGDVGRGWQGDVPFTEVTGWRGTLGGGLRVGFPAGSSSVIRADLAFPVGPSGLSSGPVFRISAREWIGVLDDFRSPDMARSRRSGISPDFVGAARDGSVP